LYPEEHSALFEKIRKKGLLVSETKPSYSGNRITLPQRNRITSGLSSALIAVTGTRGHGVMALLKHAHDQRVPIYSPIPLLQFSPNEDIIEVLKEYRISPICDIEPIVKAVKKDFVTMNKQSALF